MAFAFTWLQHRNKHITTADFVHRLARLVPPHATAPVSNDRGAVLRRKFEASGE